MNEKKTWLRPCYFFFLRLSIENPSFFVALLAWPLLLQQQRLRLFLLRLRLPEMQAKVRK